MKRPIKRTEKVRCTITLDKDVFVDSALFINNLSGFINKTLKEYILYKTKELEKDNKTTADSSSDNNRLCVNDNDNSYSMIDEIMNKIKIASTQWTESTDK